MDNPDDDYLSDSEIRIRNLAANLRTATAEISALRAKLAAAERDRDEWHGFLVALQTAIVGKTGESAILKVGEMHATISAQASAIKVAPGDET